MKKKFDVLGESIKVEKLYNDNLIEKTRNNLIKSEEVLKEFKKGLNKLKKLREKLPRY
jgi:hypothetical protein